MKSKPSKLSDDWVPKLIFGLLGIYCFFLLFSLTLFIFKSFRFWICMIKIELLNDYETQILHKKMRRIIINLEDL